jgi:cytochrome b
MRHHLVYDLPTRIFHWLFSGLFLTAFVIAKTIDDDSPIYSWHMLAGLTLSFVVILRILWGFLGTQHAKFSGFALNPMDLLAYFKGILKGEKRRWAGHNPASSWAAIAMMVMALGLGITGYLMTSGSNKEDFEDIHELLANGFIIVVIMHVAGIILHTMRFKEMISLSMVDGKKADIVQDQTISSSKNGIGIVLIALVVAFGLNLFKNYNAQTQSLNLFGTTLQLGENEGSENESGEAAGKNNENGAEKEDDDD